MGGMGCLLLFCGGFEEESGGGDRPLSFLVLVVLFVVWGLGVAIATANQSDEGTHAEFPCVGAGGDEGFLLGGEVGLGAEANGGAAGEEGEGSEGGEDEFEGHGDYSIAEGVA